MTSRSIRVRIAWLGAALCLGAACVVAQQQTVQEPPSLGRPPMFQQYVDGLLARTVYVSEDDGPVRVEIWDLLVGPGRRTVPFQLPGGAVLEIRSGTGTAMVSGKEQRIRLGTSVRADDGSQIVLINADSETLLAVRAIVIAAR